MPKLTIYLPDSLYNQVKENDIRVSEVCQGALERAVRERCESLLESVGEYFREQASWRRSVAEQYEDDPRNGRCADGLEELATAVTGIPCDHLLVKTLRIISKYELDTLRPPLEGETSYIISRFHFSPSDDETPEHLLDRLPQSWAEDEVRWLLDAVSRKDAGTLNEELLQIGIDTGLAALIEDDENEE